MSTETVPIIDISPFLSGDEAGKASVALQVADACTSIGFFAIKGHGVPQDIIEDLREASHTYFEQTEEIKRADMHPVADTPRGFRELAGEALGRTVVPDANPDMKEFYHYGPENWPDDPYFTGSEGQNYFIPEFVARRARNIPCGVDRLLRGNEPLGGRRDPHHSSSARPAGNLVRR